ncbi:hypothetical protein LTR02_014229 [Friedmanniomyces endolithicus]|nr:hypothetical protein LTR94_004737 [Friedmanniomyces endolithicus]KAK0813919.1 hypothetical protein LTR59_001075 [Friedmanniomyces endolithicus]KAK0819638.1 hypothetical protein LTR38_000391 [Friedmanniomyces endolithicus]KAK0858324.1 hypothetical protein LTR03_000333 [Friedmanniomyces endolithicus]KAK0873239.1 hypothetical protein LTS02_000790 [Friedmanniomyces endolithicus]
MAVPRYCPSCLSLAFATSTIFRAAPRRPALLPLPPPQNQQPIQLRPASTNALKYRRKDPAAAQRRKKARSTYLAPDLKNVVQFSLVDAMRYLRASEVGRPPTSSKYELHVRLRTAKNGAVVRNRLRLPHPVKTDLRICVIAPSDSPQGLAATAAGAAIVGEEEVFQAIRDETMKFDRCLCHTDSLPALTKANLGRMLGPKGLMPSVKTNTVVKDVAAAVREMAGASEYRERMGVVRMAIGQLGFTAEEVRRNIRAFVENVKRDMQGISDQTAKEMHEVVLSSTNGPGLSLNGTFGSADADLGDWSAAKA